jgi:hypothetical protein
MGVILMQIGEGGSDIACLKNSNTSYCRGVYEGGYIRVERKERVCKGRWRMGIILM